MALSREERNERNRVRRSEFAREQGYDTYAQYQRAYREIRDRMEERESPWSVEQLQQATAFKETFDPANNVMKEPELRAWFDEYIGGDEDDYWDWLHDLYARE